ncbi:uncharacterized protein LY79DRAFT_558492 [Colletotrichum navitas]|uniref:Uncharacterized protein n=1 Tax=Colletotrichum navitas TaxID=681940 RepID=A0AAD8PWI2_9PEZI|nr:uncharacterized protein LY79DRAFT_558492 [Colletotrichum navitas]KAK1585405.1 hypothetical protein LY79DRAFT_558492 [Colletotrichum navitas]
MSRVLDRAVACADMRGSRPTITLLLVKEVLRYKIEGETSKAHHGRGKPRSHPSALDSDPIVWYSRSAPMRRFLETSVADSADQGLKEGW